MAEPVPVAKMTGSISALIRNPTLTPFFSGGCWSQSVVPLSRCLTETLGSYLPVDSTEFLKHPTLNGEFLANRRPFNIDSLHSLHEQNSHQICSQPDAFAADVL